VALLALARQVGCCTCAWRRRGAHHRGRPEVGAGAPVVEGHDLDGGHIKVGASTHALRLLMFVSASCPLCKGLIPVAKSFAHDERINLTFVGDDDVATQRKLIAQQGLEAYTFLNGPDVGQAFAVGKLPMPC
jgi:methylamine dehydrogenase accessory protein MauD